MGLGSEGRSDVWHHCYLIGGNYPCYSRAASLGVTNLMPIQEYDCPEHGKFEVVVPIKDDVPEFAFCPVPVEHKPYEQSCSCSRRCDLSGPWVPPTVSFPGGPTTGARPPEIKE